MKKWSVSGILFFGLLFTTKAFAVGSCVYSSDDSTGTIVVIECGPPAMWATYTGCDPNDTPPIETGCTYPAGCPRDQEAYIPEECGLISRTKIKPVIILDN